MDTNFLENLLEAVIEITDAERGLAVSEDLAIQKVNNVEITSLESESFMEFANETMQQAIDAQNAIVTNNIITDISDAPTTNTNFSDLRVIVALPIKNQGAVYVDQHIRNGVIPKGMTDKLMQTVRKITTSGDLTLTKDQIIAIFDSFDD